MSKELYQDHIEVTAERQETESWRLIRLERVIGYVGALNDSTLSKVIALHDSKGLLTVRWSSEPNSQEKVYFSEAWGSLIGDGASMNVEHMMIIGAH
jgi:hypothetical protein